MKLRVLIVEDDKDQLEGIEKDLLQLSEEQKRHYGIKAFVIDKAMTEEGALALLNNALESSSPYDLVLLDLSLPLNEVIMKESPERGVKILKFANASGAAKGVIVVSVFSEYEWVVKSFHGGADDFIAKPYTREVLQTQVLKYFERKGERIIKQRVQSLAPYAENDLAYRLGVCFSRFVQSVVNEVEGLEDGFKERWGLDIKRDSHDSQVRQLILLEEAVGSAKREWSDVLAQITHERNGEDALTVCVVEDLLRETKDDVYPSLALKKVDLTGDWSGEAPVRTFQDDVRVVFREIILGALSRLTDHDNSPKEINVSISKPKGRVEVHFNDKLGLMEPESVASINAGLSVSPEPRFERVWGLSVVQHIARRGGGRIQVKSSEEGNRITYSIPLADHA